MTHRRVPEGVYWESGRGRYVGVVELPAGAEGKRRRRRVVGPDPDVVAAKMERLRSDAARGVDLDSSRTTLTELFDAWRRLALDPSDLSETTRTSYQWSLEKMRPFIGERRVDELKVSQVENMLAALAKTGAARTSVSRHRFVLRRVLRWAQRREMITRNVAELAELPKATKPPRQSRALTVEEARALLEAAKTHTVTIPRTGRCEVRPRRLEALWVLSLSLGLRPGEAAGLTWPAVDLGAGLVTIRAAMKYVNEIPVGLGEVKTGNLGRGRRTLTLPTLALDALRRHRTHQVAERLAMGDRWPEQWRDLVFVTETGHPVNPANLRRELREMGKAAGIGHVNRYDLRHSAATLMAAAGMRLEDIADQLGHEDLRMARTVYVHATSRPLDAAAQVMENLLDESG